MSRAAHAVESKAVVCIEVAVSPRPVFFLVSQSYTHKGARAAAASIPLEPRARD
jgi:hypothetical protein